MYGARVGCCRFSCPAPRAPLVSVFVWLARWICPWLVDLERPSSSLLCFSVFVSCSSDFSPSDEDDDDDNDDDVSLDEKGALNRLRYANQRERKATDAPGRRVFCHTVLVFCPSFCFP